MLKIDEVEIILTANSTIDEEVVRNVKVILTTLEGTVPYDRSFGITPDLQDLPVNEVQGLYTVECIAKIRKYEPRAAVQSVDFIHDTDEGIIYPKVAISVGTA